MRQVGYATSYEESEEGVASVAVAIGAFAAGTFALNVAAPVHRMSERAHHEMADELASAAKQIAGYLV